MMILLLLCTVSFASGFGQYVILKDVTSDPGLPETITMDVERDGRPVTRLNLQQNKRLNENANVVESDLDQENRRREPGEATRPLKGVKYYHDKRNGAALSVSCEETPSGSCIRAVEGFLNIGNETFEILPASDTATTRNTRNSRQNIHLISRVAHFKRFHEREGKTDKKYSQDYIETNKLVTRRKSSVRRQSKTEYAVEIIAVIDPYLWKRYLDKTEASDGMTKEEATEYRIRRKLAHVMNGVSLRYESIEDPDLNVYVTISEFRFFKTDDDKSPVPKGSDAPTIKDGEPYVDSTIYVRYIAKWKESLTGLQHDDHIMVFTGCELYDGDISANAIAGMAPMPGACTYGRVSIQEERNYFITATIAAHELGHNLNSYHDGDGDSAACEPDDRFIMAPSVTQLSAKGKYTINPWRFSPCSIASFKIYFQSEDGKCLTDHGDYYDKAEWDKHNEKLPGELHSLDKQCKLIHGDYSGVCPYGVPVTDERICRELNCVFKPGCSVNTPARGSPCGNPAEKKWCIDGKCVAKEIGGTTARPTTPKPSPTLPETPDVECFETTAMLYKGHKKVTISGKECIPWTETAYQYPSTFPDSTVVEASNYCRSPDNDTHPWCFYTNERWEHCDVHKCRPADYECFPTTSNMYSGTRSVTKSGLTCGSWANTIYNHTDSFPDDSISDAANYCRDPDGTGIPWCLVPDPDVVWEVCDIPKCTHK